jgi:hypothetical protein
LVLIISSPNEIPQLDSEMTHKLSQRRLRIYSLLPVPSFYEVPGYWK